MIYRYLENYNVHVLDCAGKVDMAVGLERLRRLSQELEARPAPDGVQRLLVDFRQTEWASEAAHLELSRFTRREFGLNAENPALRLAFVSRGSKGAVSDSEHWFDNDADALAWLMRDRDEADTTRVKEPRLILVKHALPELQGGVMPREWQLGASGRAGAQRLSNALRGLGPLRLEHSPERKAAQTAEVVALDLRIPRHERLGLEELDRAPQPILSREAFVAHNARLFQEPAEAVVGSESAERALSRFEAAIAAAVSAALSTEQLVVITHGTVIALFVAAHNPVDAFSVWQRLSCPALVVLSLPDYALLEVRDTL